MSSRNSSGTREIEPAVCRQEVDQILASDAFAKAPRLCSFLTYVCENSIQGRLDELTEQQIGIHVFQRSPGFNSGEDTIVRGTARHVRMRLESYYREEGKHDPVLITMPKGGYLASFYPVVEKLSPAMQESPTFPSADPLLPTAPILDAIAVPRQGWPPAAKIWLACISLLSFLLLGTGLTVMHLEHARSADPTTPGPVVLWRALFMEGRGTLIVPGNASLDAYIAWEQRAISLDQYANQTYQREVTVSRMPCATDVPLSVRSVTPMADLRLVAELVRVPERFGMPQADKWVEIRYARDLAVADTHENNLI